MSRTRKTVQSLRGLLDEPAEPDDGQPGEPVDPTPEPEGERVVPNPAGSAPSAPPAFFADEAPVVAATPAAPAVPEHRGRLHSMLDRAGDPVLAPGASGTAGIRPAGRRAGGRWRNDPHPLGRIAAVLVVLVLVGACVAVGIRVLG